MTKHITVVTPCFNEIGNIRLLFDAVQSVFQKIHHYTYSHLFIDNASTDGSQEELMQLAKTYPHVQVILNTRNFGPIRSPYYGLLEAQADAVIFMACDFQEPPELIPKFLEQWEKGFLIVVGIKENSDESLLFFTLRSVYYKLVRKLAEFELLEHFTGFGLYDRKVIETLRKIPDCYPYFRGLISELGYSLAKIGFHQPLRKRGISKANFYTLYDTAMLGITSHSKIPLRFATMCGFVMSFFSLLVGTGYLVTKLIFWNSFFLGMAPVVVGVFFIGAIQLFFIGVIGEYLGSIHTQILRRPIVVEKARFNLPQKRQDDEAGAA